MRNGVVAEAAPGMTTGDPAEREPEAARRSVYFDGLDGVGGAGRRETAGASGQRRHADLIGAYERKRNRVSHAARPIVWLGLAWPRLV
jgi:hypothetical protein